MDCNINKMVKIICWRRGTEVEAYVRVKDLYNITLDYLFTRCGAYFYQLSYHKAIQHTISIKVSISLLKAQELLSYKASLTPLMGERCQFCIRLWR